PAVLQCRIHQHDHRLDAGDDVVSRRLEWSRRSAVSTIRDYLLLRKDFVLPVFIHLAARNVAAFPFRSIDEFWLEVSIAGGNPEHCADGYGSVFYDGLKTTSSKFQVSGFKISRKRSSASNLQFR